MAEYCAHADWDHLRLYRDFCNCGTPDPLREGHGKSCPMNLPQDILEEVERLAPNEEEGEAHG